MEEYLCYLHVLVTHVTSLSNDHLQQIIISRLKDNKNELKLLDIKDIEQARQEAKLAKEKLASYQ
jgi:hypothetical protein